MCLRLFVCFCCEQAGGWAAGGRVGSRAVRQAGHVRQKGNWLTRLSAQWVRMHYHWYAYLARPSDVGEAAGPVVEARRAPLLLSLTTWVSGGHFAQRVVTGSRRCEKRVQRRTAAPRRGAGRGRAGWVGRLGSCGAHVDERAAAPACVTVVGAVAAL